jgi:hypothetical protein
VIAERSQCTASLAYEISQPLGAILANSEAARLWLDRGASGVKEVGEALTDNGLGLRELADPVLQLLGVAPLSRASAIEAGGVSQSS